MSAYGTDQGFEDWLESQGLELPTGSPTPTVLRNLGSAYIDSAYEHMLTCSARTGGFSQDLAWPRTGHYVGDDAVPDTYIPTAWINGSYRAGYLNAVNVGWSTGTSNPDRLTKREKVDVIEREFFGAGEGAQLSDVAAGMPADAIINGMIQVWLCSDDSCLGFLVV